MVNLIAELVQDWRRLDERIAAVSAERREARGVRQLHAASGMTESDRPRAERVYRPGDVGKNQLGNVIP
jgi:hypothetical protein